MSSLRSRLEQLARNQPESTVLVRHATRCTCSGLDALANHVGRELIRTSVQPESVIAVWSADPVIQVMLTFGVWKAGLTAVILDVRDSKLRLRWMLESAGIDAVITDGQSAREPSELTSTVPVLSIDPNGSSATPPEADFAPDVPALITFTSGSEGRPQGVVKTHEELLRECRYHGSELGLNSTDRIVQLHPLNFFAGLKHALTTVLSGSPLYFYDVDSQGLAPFCDWSRQEGITVIPCTVAFLRRLLRHAPGPDSFARCRCVMVGGEKLYKRDIDAFRRVFPESCKLIYVYGATECGVMARHVILEDTPVADPVPAGAPAEGKEVRFFKMKRHRGYVEQPAGETGEIAVVDSSLAPGYWKDSGMNELKYRSSPEGDGKRMYMTGDFGRLGEDGLLYLHGRNDRQVKIHGYRVDLSEVEFALNHDENVAHAVVMTTEDDSREPRLVAYVALTGDSGDQQAVLGKIENTAATNLPAYMVPDEFIVLDAMPRAYTGKADARASSVVPSSAEKRKDGGLSETENEVLEIWKSVFREKDISLDDDVLDLGVSSLLAMEMCLVLGNKFAIEVPYTQLALSPSVREISAFIDASLAETQDN
jgi:acyl-coenzyme A synthetase/AMP-(fatty) acid ligase/acyl carrier protein